MWQVVVYDKEGKELDRSGMTQQGMVRFLCAIMCTWLERMLVRWLVEEGMLPCTLPQSPGT